jgi:hypothetical protein
MELVPFQNGNTGRLAAPGFNLELFPAGEHIMLATTKIVPGRSKIAVQDPEELKYWSRHFDVTPEELQRRSTKLAIPQPA